MLHNQTALDLPCHLTGKRSFGRSHTELGSPLEFVPSYLTALRPFTVSLPTLWQLPPALRSIFSQSEQAFSASPVSKKEYRPRWFMTCAGISIYMCCCVIRTSEGWEAKFIRSTPCPRD